MITSPHSYVPRYQFYIAINSPSSPASCSVFVTGHLPNHRYSLYVCYVEPQYSTSSQLTDSLLVWLCVAVLAHRFLSFNPWLLSLWTLTSAPAGEGSTRTTLHFIFSKDPPPEPPWNVEEIFNLHKLILFFVKKNKKCVHEIHPEKTAGL